MTKTPDNVRLLKKAHFKTRTTAHFFQGRFTSYFQHKQDAGGAYIWAWLFLAYVKFVVCVRDMWVVQWYCVFEGLVEMCEVVGMELYWKLIAKMVGLVCEVVTGFLRGCFYFYSGTEVLIENVLSDIFHKHTVFHQMKTAH